MTTRSVALTDQPRTWSSNVKRNSCIKFDGHSAFVRYLCGQNQRPSPISIPASPASLSRQHFTYSGRSHLHDGPIFSYGTLPRVGVQTDLSLGPRDSSGRIFAGRDLGFFRRVCRSPKMPSSAVGASHVLQCSRTIVSRPSWHCRGRIARRHPYPYFVIRVYRYVVCPPTALCCSALSPPAQNRELVKFHSMISTYLYKSRLT